MDVSNIDLSQQDAYALIECMLAISRVDGQQPEELALISQFHNQFFDHESPGVAAIEGTPASAMLALRQASPSRAFAQLVVFMCLSTGYADGHLSDEERKLAMTFGSTVELMDAESFNAIWQEVKDQLLASMPGLTVGESVATVAREL